MIDTIIFDFDGTVMDTNKVIIASWQHTYNALTGSDGNLEYILGTFGEPLEYSLNTAFPDVPTEKSVEIYRSFHRENFGPMIELFPGVRNLLEEVKVRGYKTGIATSRVRFTLHQGLRQYGIEKYFDALISAEDVTEHKPAPETLFKVLAKLDSKPENAIMIGDTMPDILCARNAGVKSVLVAWTVSLAGKKIEDFAEGEAPDFIIEKPESLFEII
ncbi:MAG: HAD family hydrolase [Lentihominibacter sp.]|jgi:pyrophosphatase PpaX